MKTLSAIILITFFSAAAFAQAGELDSTFGVDGKVLTQDYYFIQVSTIAIAPDGKIIATGGIDFPGPPNDGYVVRYNIDGSLDSSFGIEGSTYCCGSFDDIPKSYSVAIQQDGKIIVVDSDPSDNAVDRFDIDGSLETTLSANWNVGFVTYNAIAIQPDSKIVILGTAGSWSNGSFALLRCDSTGVLDNSFGVNGTEFIPIGLNAKASALALQQDGKIVAAGVSSNIPDTDFAVCRFFSSGEPDSSFDLDGIVTTNLGSNTLGVRSVVIQSDGKIVAAGVTGNYLSQKIKLVRYNIDGSTDNSFGLNGIVTAELGTEGDVSMAIQPNGQIVVSETKQGKFLLIRFDPNGNFDFAFGMVTIDFSDVSVAAALAIQPDGKIIEGGGCANGGTALARFLAALNVGILNFSSSQSSPLIYPNPIHQTETLEYTLTKNETLTIALYDVNGKLIRNFISNEQRTAGEHKETLNIGELPSGNYFLTLSNGSQKMSVKLVKQ